ncbi:MAG: hypothetical protein JSS78_00095 [Bacteroidetes bacterium]|nr:hypothetical protein [Bacteroidota bacterium]
MIITPLHPMNRDERGYNCEYDHQRTGKHILVFSRAGVVRGGHFHKGISLAKNPEEIILLSGVCEVQWREVNFSEVHVLRVEAPARISIPPYTWHQFVFETDSAMIEMNGLAEHIADTFYGLD